MKRTIRFLMLLMLSIVSVTAMASDIIIPENGLKIYEIGNDYIKIKWENAVDPDGCDPSKLIYRVGWHDRVDDMLEEPYTFSNFMEGTNKYKITGLKPNTKYKLLLQVRRPGDAKFTRYKTTYETTTNFHPIVKYPGLEIMNATDSTITVGWNKVWETIGNKKNITYIVQYEGRNKWYETLPYPKYRVEMTDQDTYTIRKNLWDNLEYHVTVFARGPHDTKEAEVGYKVVKTKETTDNEVFVRADYPDRMYDVSIRDNSLEVEVIRPYNSNNTVTGITHKIYVKETWDNVWKLHPCEGYRVANSDKIRFKVTDLKPETDYNLLPVSINDANGNKMFYDVFTRRTREVPDNTKPTLQDRHVEVSHVTKNTATLTWVCASDDRTPKEGLRYNLYIFNPKVEKIREYHVYDQSEITVYDLEPSTEYTATLSVNDQSNNFIFYDDCEFTTNDGTAPVIADPDIRVTKYYAKGFTVEWTPATDNVTAQDELIYFVGFKDSSDLNFNIVATLKGETSYTFNPLNSPYRPYDVKIYVYDKAGNHSEYEVIKRIMHPHYKPIVNDKEIQTSNLTYNGVTLKWAEAYDEYTPADEMDYAICCGLDGYSSVPIVAQVHGTTSYTLSDLAPNTRYKIMILAINGDGDRSEYNAKIITTEKDPTIAEEYGLYVNGESVTSLNCTNAPSIRGKVTYNDKAKTLVLKDAELSSIDSRIPLNIFLEGYNTVKGNIVSKDNRLRFLGSGKLYVEGSTPCEVGDSLIIEGGCTVSLSGSGSYALGLALNQKGIYINASSLKVNGGGIVPSVIGCTELVLTDCEFLSDHSYVNSEFVDAKGNEATDRIKIGPKDLIPPTLPVDDDTPTIKVKDHEGAWVSWYRAEDNVSDERLTYEVYVKNANTDTYGAEPEYSDVLTSCHIGGLEPNTEYTIRVAACDAAGNKAYYKEVSFTTDPDPLEGRRYPVYIMGNQVNGDNCNDILGDGGSMTYDPDTRTLKLDNVTLSGSGQAIQAYEGINIDLVGTNIINTETGIFTTSGQSNIISGSGSLIVMSATPINGWGNIALTGGCTVELDATGCGTPAIMLAYNTISVDGSTLKAKGDAPNPSIYGCSTLYLYGGTAITSGQRFDSASGQFLDAQGNMATDEVVITLRPGDTIAPTITDDVIVVTKTTDSSISLSWTAATDNETKDDELSYGIELIGGGEGFFQDPGKSTSWTFTGLKPETTYTIKISVKDNAGNESSYKETTATTTSSLATSISDIQNNGGDSSIYGTDGVRRSSLKNGINIVITPDGKAVKMTRK